MEKFRKRIAREIFCFNRKTVLLFAAAAVLLGLLFALGGVNRYVYWHLFLPRGALPPFFMVLLWGLMLALFGVCMALAFDSPFCDRHITKNMLLLLFCASLVLCYVWIPMVYKAAAFFLALLIVVMLLLCLSLFFVTVWRLHKVAAAGIGIFALWILYILYYTFALFLLN